MNLYTVKYTENGDEHDVTSHAVFPISIGLLLDERLDEMYITLVEMRRKHFKMLTEFTVTLSDGTVSKVYNMIVARDQANKNLNTGRWKHRLYLLERTKLLEGLLCPSLTFTNALPRDYLKIAVRPAVTINRLDLDIPLTDDIVELFNQSNTLLKTPVAIRSSYTVPSALDIGNVLCAAFNTITGVANGASISESVPPHGGDPYTTQVTIIDGNTTETAQYNNTITLTLSDAPRFTLEYIIVIHQSIGDFYATYKVTYIIDTAKSYDGLKKYTITDVVNRVLECAEPIKSGSGGIIPGAKYTFDEAQAAEYETILAPEFSMTQCTLREQLKVVGSFIHAEPRLTANNTVYFDPYGVTEDSYLDGFLPIAESEGAAVNEYCTEIRANAQNLVSSLGFAQGVTIDPGEGWYRSLRAENAFVRIGESNGVVYTGLPIYSLREDDEAEIRCGILNADGTYWLEPCNITPFVFEATEYNANLSSYSEVYPYSKSYAIYYTQGQKNINGLFFKPDDALSSAVFGRFAITNILGAAQSEKSAQAIQDHLVNGGVPLLVFNVKYKPIYPTLVSHGKSLYIKGETKYAQIYNQGENLIETQYYGENLKGVAARLGNVEREITYIFKSLSSIPKVGDMYDGYAISAVSIEFQANSIKCTVGLTKDFNRISEYVGVNSVKRMYEISERQTYNRDILIHNTLVIGKKPISGLGDPLFTSAAGIRDLFLAPSYRTVQAPVSIAVAMGETKGNEDLTPVTLPVISTALGNAITFRFSYADNYSAGSFADAEASAAVNGVTGYWQNEVRYTDYYGRMYWLNFLMRSTADLAPVDSAPLDLPQTTLFPASSSHIKGRYLVRKDSREMLSVTAELEIKTEYDDIIIGSALAKFSRDLTDADVTVQMITVDGRPRGINKFASQYDGQGRQYDVTHLLSVSALDGGNFTLESFNAPVEGQGWVIRTAPRIEQITVEDEDGTITTQSIQLGNEILLASNTPFKYGAPIFGYESDGRTPRNLDFYIVSE